jgi:hypothetical protein
MAVDPGKPCAELSDASIQGLPLNAARATTLLRFSSIRDGFRFLHQRQWRVMVDRHDVTILRLVEQGDLIAQCNASKLRDLPAGQHVQLEAFQADIQRALGPSFGQFVEASQSKTEHGLRVLRAVASGVASELPIQWTYYHVSDDKGRQVALVFTTDATLAERLAKTDGTIVGSLEFIGSPEQASTESSPRSQGDETAVMTTGVETAKRTR